MADLIDNLDPILCAPLVRRIDGALIALLSALEPEDWGRQTVAQAWQVRDVAAHLLDTALRRLSLARDGWFVEAVDLRTPQDLIDLVNRLNREGVTVYRRLSPPVLIAMMRTACDMVADYLESLDPFAQAALAVSWAGEDSSLNWFDIARELTERWHHQQQIRLAMGKLELLHEIMIPELYHPVLDCFLRGLPHLFRDVEAADGTRVLVEVSGECGGGWMLARSSGAWKLLRPDREFASRVVIPQEIAWRVFTKGISRGEALGVTRIEGDRALGERVLGLTAIVG